MGASCEVGYNHSVQSFEPARNKQDRYVSKLCKYLYRIDSSAADLNDEFVRKNVVERLYKTLVIIRHLLKAFHQTPEAPLEEIAQSIGLSKNALYFILASHGIEHPKELRKTTAHVATFLKQNRIHGALVKLVMDVRGDYLRLRDALDVMNHKELFVDWKEAYGIDDAK